VAFLAGVIVSTISIREPVGVSTDDVTIGSGITLRSAVDAFSDERIREEADLSSVNVFSKSGGRINAGQMQQVLKVDLPINVTNSGDDVSFQYFVEVKDDMNGLAAVHCGDIRLHVYLDSRNVYVTKWLGYDDRYPVLPLDTGRITIHDISAGLHDIGLVPEARAGGCNAGFIQSWGGTSVVFN
jgi:hypothetical protein